MSAAPEITPEALDAGRPRLQSRAAVLRDIADRQRERMLEARELHYGRGYVILNPEWEVAGWACALTWPKSWVPGCYAIPNDAEDPIFLAVGGDNHSGAKAWQLFA